MVLAHTPLFICMQFQLVRYPYVSLHADTHHYRCHIDIYFCHHRQWTATSSCQAVSRIEIGEYIDMIELLPNQLGTTRSPANDDSVRAVRQRRRELSGILQWIQSFATYTGICCQNQPHRIQDLLGYQTLIIEASLEYQGDGWLGYDQQFQQRAAANPALVWANTDTTLWNLACCRGG